MILTRPAGQGAEFAAQVARVFGADRVIVSPLMMTEYLPIVPRLAAERAPTGEYCRAFEMLLERTESSSQPPLPETGSRNAEAMTAFEDLARRYPTDPLVRLHLSRLHAGETGDIIVLENK